MRTMWRMFSLCLIGTLAACDRTSDSTAPETISARGLELSKTAAATLTLSSLDVGVSHVCGLGLAGELYCWGDGYSPTPARFVQNRTFTTVSAANLFTCGITSSRATACWGTNAVGQLGNGTTTNSTRPTLVAGSVKFTSLGGSVDHSCALSRIGAAYCWGSNLGGQLGTGSFFGPESCHGLACSTVPVAVVGGLTFTQVHGTDAHSCGLNNAAQAYCWGKNGYGQLGTGGFDDSASPVGVTGGLSFVDLDVGFGISCAVTGDGTPYCWGLDPNGEPCGPFFAKCTPTPYLVPGGFHFTSIAAGGYHFCGITADHAAYCWGSNLWGNLGNGTTEDTDTPVPVSGGIAFASLSNNAENTCGVATDGTAYCWGSNQYGQLGIGTTWGPDDCGPFGPCSKVPVAVLAPET